MKTKKTFTYGDTEIAIVGSRHALVPKSCNAISISKAQKNLIARVFTDNLFCKLSGEAGTGKSQLVQELAYLRQQPLIQFSCSEGTDESELIGYERLEGDKKEPMAWNDGIVIHAMRIGAILVLDEANMLHGATLSKLHAILDERKQYQLTGKNKEVVFHHPDTRIFITVNNGHIGTKSFNEAFKTRFGVNLDIDILPVDEEIDLLIKRTGITKEQASMIVTMATKARIAKQEDDLPIHVSTRSLLHMAQLVKSGIPMHDAYKSAVTLLADDTDTRAVLNDYCLQVLKFADESDKAHMPIVTTQAEMKRLKDNAIAYHKKAVEFEIEADKVKRELDAIMKSGINKAELEKAQAENTKLQEKINAYKVLMAQGSDADIVNSNT